MILTEADLSRYQDSPKACWVLDTQRARIIWANPAAVAMLRAPTLDDLLKRDLSPRSLSARTRLEIYLERTVAGKAVSTQWTSMASGAPITFLADLDAWRGPAG